MLLLCYGTRPEWIKIKPIIEELKRNSLEFKVAFTGQQKDIGRFYSDYELLMTNNKFNRLDSIFSQIFIECNKKNIFKDINFVLVQGDTATATAISIAAFHRKIKLFHLEAGLRTFDKDNPYPEEVYRNIIGKIADYHLCPTQSSVKNLKDEKTQGEMHLIGNTVLDNLNEIKTNYADKVLITMHRRENIEIIEKWFSEIESLTTRYPGIEFLLPIHPNPNILKHKSIFKNVKVVSAMNHKELIKYLSQCKVVITDSGGIQEESSFLKKRCIVCRKETERIEGLSSEGHAILCKKPDLLKLIKVTSRLTAMEKVLKSL